MHGSYPVGEFVVVVVAVAVMVVELLVAAVVAVSCFHTAHRKNQAREQKDMCVCRCVRECVSVGVSVCVAVGVSGGCRCVDVLFVYHRPRFSTGQ